MPLSLPLPRHLYKIIARWGTWVPCAVAAALHVMDGLGRLEFPEAMHYQEGYVKHIWHKVPLHQELVVNDELK